MYKYGYKYDEMLKSFSGRETMVGMQAWSYWYNAAVVKYSNAGREIKSQFELMRTYHDLLFQHFGDTQTALAHEGDQQYLRLLARKANSSLNAARRLMGKLWYISRREMAWTRNRSSWG